MWLRIRGYDAEPHSRLYHFESVMGRERQSAQPQNNKGSRWATADRFSSTTFSEVTEVVRAYDPYDIPRNRSPLRTRHRDQYSGHAYHVVDLDEDAIPPPSIIREYSTRPYPPSPGSTHVASPFSNATSNNTPISPPSNLVMPSPLSPARFPQFTYTDERLGTT